jgi:cell division protein DivIC
MKFPKTVGNKYVLLRKFVMNKFRLTAILFLVWMLFFDNKNAFIQFRLSQRIHELKTEMKNYESMYVTIKGEHKDLTENIEKFAREKYYMHKENEEVFIIK